MNKSDDGSLLHYRVCNYCEAMCGLKIEYTLPITSEDDLKISADKDDPFSQGSICPKAQALSILHFDKEKLRYPVKKMNGTWVKTSWDEAYDLVEKGIKSVQDQYGTDAIGTYLGNPIVHNLGMMLFISKFTKAIGSKNLFSATSMDQLPHHFVSHFMFGHEMRIPIPDIDNTEYMIMIGANPLASNGSIMTSAGVRKRLKSIIEDGGKVVLLDPRKNETARLVSEHLYVVPGSDIYFLLALLYIAFRDSHVDLGRLQPYVKNFDQIVPISKKVTPAYASEKTGIDDKEIERLASEFFQSKKAVIYGRMGVCTQSNGGLNQWLINILNIISGNFDTPGGMMFTAPAIELAREKQQKNIFGRFNSRVRGLKEFSGELPVSAMAEEFSVEGKGQLKAFITVCGNPVLTSPNGRLLDDSIKDIDFMVSIDNYINETTRHADLILPTPSGLEIDHYDLIFNAISVNNNAKFSEALIKVEEDRPYDWQVLKELTKRFSKNGLSLIDRAMTPRLIINIGLLTGVYGRLSSPKRWFSGLSLKKVIDSKHGISLGSLRPSIPGILITHDKKIDLAPDIFVEALQKALEVESENRILDKEEFRLIGRRDLFTNNSWMHQVKRLSSNKNVRCTAMLHKSSASVLQIEDGDEIIVRSNAGEIRIVAEVNEEIVAGVVSIPHGFGHTREDTQNSHARAKAGVSVNDITDHNVIDPLTGNAAFSGQIVTIRKV